MPNYNLVKSTTIHMKTIVRVLAIILQISGCDTVENKNVNTNEIVSKSEVIEKKNFNVATKDLLIEAKKYLAIGNYHNAKEILDTLLSRIIDKDEIAETNSLLDNVNDEIAWQNALNASDLSVTENYIRYFSKGKYIKIAKKKIDDSNITNEKRDYQKAVSSNTVIEWNAYLQRYPNSINSPNVRVQINKLENETASSNEKSAYDDAMMINTSDLWKLFIRNYPKSENIKIAKPRYVERYIIEEKKEYQRALEINSSSVWQAFIEKFPHRADIENLKKRKIKQKVEEVLASKEAGQIPYSVTEGNSNSKIAQITITNNTNCPLNVMYVGSDIMEVNLLVNETKKIKLSSGGYSVAAEACGNYYAGKESLKGKHSVKYTITNR